MNRYHIYSNGKIGGEWCPRSFPPQNPFWKNKNLVKSLLFNNKWVPYEFAPWIDHFNTGRIMGANRGNQI